MSRGFTLVEAVVCSALLAVLLCAADAIWHQATRSLRQSGERAGAMRSAMLAIEAVRADAERMLFETPSRDLRLLDDAALGPGRGLCLRIPAEPRRADPWSASYVPVTYTLRRIGRSGAHHLERCTGVPPRASVVGGCVLRDLKLELVPAGLPESAGTRYLEIRATGLDEPGGLCARTLSQRVPLPLSLPAGTYTLRPGEV